MIDITDVILASPYYAQVNCIRPVLQACGIYDYHTLQNAPILVKGPICGIDIFQFVAVLNGIYGDYYE